MKNILLFGAGKSATVLIDYLLDHSPEENWQLILVDADLHLAQSKINNSQFGKAISFDIMNDDERGKIIEYSDIVISLMPPALHILIAKDCIRYKKNLLTASYEDEAMRDLKNDIEKNNLLFLCEMGLDPGIDHMSAKRMIDNIKEDDGEIVSFLSHCGGLIAPESDNNPWHYKITWNPRNIVLAGKSGAVFRQTDKIVEWPQEELFAQKRYVSVPGHDILCWYPNRDSLSYISLYELNECSNFIRTTLRHPDFIYGWKNVLDLKLTAEKKCMKQMVKLWLLFLKNTWMHMTLVPGWSKNCMSNLMQQKIYCRNY